MSHLLDTNFIIGLLRGVQSYWDYLQVAVERNLPSISTVTRAEIYAGCHPAEERETRRLLNCLRSVPVSRDIADLAGRYVYQFARRGVTLHLEDALIGATAVQEELILVTHNVSHFPMLTLGKSLLEFPAR
jgi:predicted nucleic acid-binding protein